MSCLLTLRYNIRCANSKCLASRVFLSPIHFRASNSTFALSAGNLMSKINGFLISTERAALRTARILSKFMTAKCASMSQHWIYGFIYIRLGSGCLRSRQCNLISSESAVFPMHVRPVAAGLRSDRTDAFINEQSPRPNKVYANLIILMTLFACNEAYLVASIGAVKAIINCAAVRFSVPIVSSLCDDRAKSERILAGRLLQELCGYKSG